MSRQGIHLEIPDLSQGDFEHLTITAQLNVVEETLHGEPACIIGSSMGGYLAALYASAHKETQRLVLLAPAFDFASRLREITSPEKLAKWRETGSIEVFHYGEGIMRRVHYSLLEDAPHYPPNPDFHQPALIFHGIHDPTVPIDRSRAFVAAHPAALLTELDSGHELLNVLDNITAAAVPFLLNNPNRK